MRRQDHPTKIGVQTLPHRRWALRAAAGLAMLLAGVTAGAQVTINWNNPAGGSWGDAGNWNPQNVPNEPGEEAVFPMGGGTFTTYLAGSYTLDRVLIDNPNATLDLSNRTFNFQLTDGLRNTGTLLASANYSQLNGFLNNRPGGLFRIPEAGVHYFNSDSLRNEGTIHIGTAGGASEAMLYFSNGARLLTGSGECILESGGTPARAAIRGYYGSFTQTADHTIHGSGGIYCGFTNYGTILADVHGEELWVHTTARTNHATLAATNGGVLVIGNQTTTQGPSGVILADGGSVVMGNDSRIVGGTLSTANEGVITGGATHYLTEIANTGQMDLLGGARVYWSGAGVSTNDGIVTINADASETDAILNMYNNAVTIEGSGTFVLSTAGDVNDAQLAAYYGSMIQGAGHTIRGDGRISTGIDNYGTISADVSGRALALTSAAKTNRNLMQAMNGGILRIESGAITQDPGATIFADGGIVQLANNADVTGGILDTANGGVVEAYNASYLSGITNLGALSLPEGSRVYWHAGQSVNNGTITINPTAGSTDAILHAYNGTLDLSGTGQIVMRTAGDVNDAQLSWYYGHLIQGPGHTIRGEGRIITSLQNDGLVSADAAGRVLQLDSGTKTNNAVMQATGGGLLSLCTTIDQAPDAVLLADGGTVQLSENSTVNGGILRTVNDGRVQGAGSHFFNNVTNEGDFNLVAGARSYCGGTSFVNNGTLAINREQSATDAVLHAYNSTVRIEGNGEIVLATTGDVYDAQIQGYYGRFVQGPNHIIRGDGLVNVHLTNEGIVRADVPGRTLHLGGDVKLNQALMEAADSSRLQFNTGSLANQARIVARDGGEVRLDQMGQHYDPWARTLTGGWWEVYDGSTMRMIAVDPRNLNAGVLLSGPTSVLCRDEGGTSALTSLNTIQLAGTLALAAGRDFDFNANLTNAGSLVVGEACSLRVPGSLTQIGCNPSGIQHQGAGWTTVNGTLVSPDTLRFEGGSVMGTGIIAGNVKSGARVSPGTSASAGTLTIGGGYVQTASGHFYVEVGDPQPGHHDQLNISGHAKLSGRIWVAELEGYTPSAGDVITVMTFASREGEFTEKWGCPRVGLDYEVIYEPNAVKIALFNAPSAVEEPLDPTVPEAGGDPATGPATELVPTEVRLSSAVLAGEARLALELPQPSEVLIEAFDLTGRRVATLESGSLAAGRHDIGLARSSHAAGRLVSGVYLARATVRAGDVTMVCSTRVLLVR